MDVALYVIAAAVLVVLIVFAVKVRRQTRAGRTTLPCSAAAVGRSHRRLVSYADW